MSELKIYYEKDCDLERLPALKVAVIGYGSQGHVHALNLKDSGVSVIAALRPDSSSRPKAQQEGLEVMDIPEAVAATDMVMVLAPDEHQAGLYSEQIEPNLKQGAVLAFAHGFNIHYGRIKPRADLDVVMIAPKGPGHTVRSTFTRGAGVPALVAVAQDSSGNALDTALSYAACLGAGKVGIIETTFRDETETDLFGEQAVLCGGLTELIIAGFETLVEAGYAPELAYFECAHEVKLIVDLIYEGGLANMFYSVSNTAEYGGYRVGPQIVDAKVKERMKEVLQRVQNGDFAREFTAGNQREKITSEARQRLSDHSVEKTGAKLRDMMAVLMQDRLVDRDRN